MQEEIFISGRNIPHIDPSLEVWHFPISLYLFLDQYALNSTIWTTKISTNKQIAHHDLYYHLIRIVMKNYNYFE